MDFLTNGFHQLYSELDDEFSIWDYSSVECAKSVEVNNNHTCDYYSFVDNQETLELTNILSNDCGKTFEPFQSDYENSLDYLGNSHVLESDWENAFLENYIEIPDLTDLLPERTPLCNDSCNLFLKESSDNLSKFRPIDGVGKARRESSLESSVFPCTFGTCSKVYAKPAHLKAHIRRHLGDKPYVCTWPNCTWKFSRSDELARHKRSHSGFKPYKCIYCTKCFARSDHLAKHRKVHERKMAANKLKGIIFANLQHVRPGRKPKETSNNNNNNSIS